jgi:hypothetical protein
MTHLTTLVVDNFADVGNSLLKDTERGGVGDHEASEVLLVFLSLGHQVAHVDGAVLADVDCLHLHAGHLRGRWVGAVSRHWDQADVAVSLSFGLQVRLDGSQTGILSLSSTTRTITDN